MPELPSGTLTFLFTDVERSTDRWERHPAAMEPLLDRHDALIREAVERHGGQVFKTVGDGFYCVFRVASEALAVALAAQRALQSEPCGEVEPLRVRMALNTGPASPRNGDYLGPALNRLSRLLETAHGGQILLTSATAELVRDSLPVGSDLRSLGEHHFKYVSRPIGVFQLAAPDLLDDRPLRVELESNFDATRPGDEHGHAHVSTLRLQAYLLDGFRVVLRGSLLPESAWERQKARQLFKCLLTRPRHRLMKDEAIELFWPDSDPGTAEQTLRSTLTSIRRALRTTTEVESDGNLILADHGLIRFNENLEVWTDAAAFEQLLRQAKQHPNPDSLLEQADALYTGDYLPDDLYEEWAIGYRDALRQQWLELQLVLARRRAARGEAGRAADALQRVLRTDPCQERAARALMRLLARADRRADALRVHEQLVQTLREKLDVAPSPRTVELQQQIVSGAFPAQHHRPASPPAERRSSATSQASKDSSVDQGSAADHLPTPEARPFFPAYPFPEPEQFVGRESELKMLERLLGRGRKSGQTVFLGAPAGTGKSTLLGVLTRRAQQAGSLVLAGACYEQEGLVPLGPVRDALVDYLLTQPADRMRADLGPAADDLAEVVPELRYHLSLSNAPSKQQIDQIRLFAAIHTCLRGLAQRSPVLLCLEDLHAADAATLDLIHFLTRQTRRLPFVLVATFRSEELANVQQLTRLLVTLRREGAEQINLAPLGREETARLITALLDGPATEALSTWLYETTEGNPLFLEQLVLVLCEEGRVDRQEGVWQQIADASGSLPTVIRDVIGRRIDRLNARSRETLAMAAVLGHTFEHELLLASLAPRAQVDVLEELEEALGAQLIQETPTGFAFSHALVREVLYWSLSAPRRLHLHARAGYALEELAGPSASEQASELAHHFAHAGHSPTIQTKALYYSLEAGRRAADLSAYQESLAHFTRACGLIGAQRERADPVTYLDALEGRGYAERDLAMWFPCISSFRQVLELSDDPVRRGRARSAIAFALQQIGDTAQASVEIEAGLRELDSATDSAEAVLPRLRLQFQQALIWFLQGRCSALFDLGQQMLRGAEKLGQPRPLFWAHTTIGWVHLGQGQIEQALEQHHSALEAAKRTNNKVPLALAHSNLGNLLYCGGQFTAAREHLEIAIRLYHDAGSDLRAVITRQTLGRIWLAEGNLARAREEADCALSLAEEGRDRWAAECHDLLGCIYSLRSDWEAAAASFERALTIREQVGHTAGIVESLVGLGSVEQWRGSWPRARELYVRALEVAGSMDCPPQEVAARWHLGRLLLLLGHSREATEQLERALTLIERMVRSLEYAPTLLAVAELRWRASDLTGAVDAATTALSAAVSVDALVDARATLAALHAAAQQPLEARAHADEALRLAEHLGAPRLLGLANVAAGRAAFTDTEDGFERAVAYLETAIDLLETARTPYEHALALQEYALMLARHHLMPERAGHMLEKAQRVFSQLGARPASTQAASAFGAPSLEDARA